MGPSSHRSGFVRRLFHSGRRGLWLVALGAALPTLAACRDSGPTVVPPSPPPGPAIRSLTASPASLNLQAGQQRVIELVARDSAGKLVANPAVTWRSDAPATAAVDAAGVIRAVAPGTARVTATVGALSAVVQVGVSGSTPGVVEWRIARPGFSDITILGLWDDGAGSSYAVGQGGIMLRSRSNGPWEVISLNTTETLTGVWGSSPTDIWIVGAGGVLYHGDGVRFAAVSSGTTATLLEVWGLAANDVFIAGDRGTILHFDGTTWTAQPTPVTEDLWGIWGANATNVFVVGNNGVILRWNGTSWQRMATPNANPLFDVWGTSVGNVFAVGISGTILRFDGVQWSPVTAPGRANLFAMRGRAFNDVYAVGNGGTTYHFDGTTWRALSIGSGQNLRAIAPRGDGTLRLAGWWGTVITLRSCPTPPCSRRTGPAAVRCSPSASAAPCFGAPVLCGGRSRSLR
jgi:hypothetical protein